MSNFAAGLIAIVLIAVGTYLGFTKNLPFTRGYQVQAAFKDSVGIRKSSPVRIAGVEVGKVVKVEPAGKGRSAAILTMEIKDNGRPLHRDAEAKIRPRIFLEGNFFVDVSPGTPSAKEMKDGDMIPLQRTSVPVQLDQVLAALPGDTRKNLRGALAELFRTYSADGGAAFNRSLEFQPDAYKFTSIVADALQGREPRDLSNTIRDLGGVSEALNANPEQLASLVTDFNRTVGALASEQGSLQAAVREIPRTLRAASPAFDDLNEAFPDLRRLAREGRPGLQSTPETLDALQPLVVQLRALVRPNELRGLTRDLRASTPALTGFARTAVPLLGETRALSSCANQVLLPFANDKIADKAFPATGTTNQEFWKALVGLAGESRSSDANGQWFKVLGTGGSETFSLGNGQFGTSSSSFMGTNPPKAKRRPPLVRDVACETQQPPDLRTIPGGPPPSMNNGPGGLPSLPGLPPLPDLPELVAKRQEKAKAVAVETLRKDLLPMGKRAPKVLDRYATKAEVAK